MENKDRKNICDELLFSSLFKEYASSLHRYLYYKYGSGFDLDDTVQEAFIKLWDNCSKVTFSKVKGFLFKVASNHVLNKIKHQKVVMSYKQRPTKNYTVENPEFLMEEKQYMEKYKKALEKLTEGQRIAFLMNRIEGKKHKEIAALLGISSKAVEKRIYGALNTLRKEIEGI